jgi:hypothetical protein
MTGPAQTPCEQLLLPFMVSRPRKLLPDLDRVRRRGGAHIEVKRAVFQSRRLHRKGKHLQAWNLLTALPIEYDLVDAYTDKLGIADWYAWKYEH